MEQKSRSNSSEEEKIDTVWKAAAYGDFDALKRLSEEQPGVLQKPDDDGYFCLQWAALNNRVAVLTYLLDAGCDINAADRTGQTALHWTAVRGSVPALETLLRAGADIGAADSRGYTVCHVAAQYGQTAVLYHLAMKWGADTDATDADGRTPLHWAAYKGYADTARLLLVMGSRATLGDKEACTPLHWAAIRGNSEACTVLLQGGAVDALDQPDSTGATPSQLAIEKGHRLLGVNLAEYKYKKEKARQNSGAMAALTRLHLSPVIWGIVLGMLGMLTFSVANTARFPVAIPGLMAGVWLTYALAGTGLYFLYKTTTADPGFLPRNTAGAAPRRRTPSSGKVPGAADVEMGESPDANSLNSPALWAGNWGQLCVGCKIVRPLRAKHCSVTDRCVQCFDHYCPWVGNAIGKGNRHLFLIFLWLEFGAILTSALIAVLRLHAELNIFPEHTTSGLGILWPLVFIVVDILLLVSVAALTIAQTSQVVRNVTTNELANWHRYRYLHDSRGEFHNPFDQGWRANCAEVCAPEKAKQAPYVLDKHARSASGHATDWEREGLLKEHGHGPGGSSS